MDVYTDMPCIQLYTGGGFSGKGKKCDYGIWSGFCLEPQYCPNAINMDGVEKPILKKAKQRSTTLNLIFSIKKKPPGFFIIFRHNPTYI